MSYRSTSAITGQSDPSLSDLHGDAGTPFTIPADVCDDLDNWYANEPELTDDELDQLDNDYQAEAARIVGAGRIDSVNSILSLFHLPPTA